MYPKVHKSSSFPVCPSALPTACLLSLHAFLPNCFPMFTNLPVFLSAHLSFPLPASCLSVCLSAYCFLMLTNIPVFLSAPVPILSSHCLPLVSRYAFQPICFLMFTNLLVFLSAHLPFPLSASLTLCVPFCLSISWLSATVCLWTNSEW